jgi:hypothetical protein
VIESLNGAFRQEMAPSARFAIVFGEADRPEDCATEEQSISGNADASEQNSHDCVAVRI